MSKKVYLVRHGESEDGLRKIHQRTDAVLSEHGRRQAGDAATRFSGIAVDIIYASPYLRTMHTAEHIAEVTGAPIEQQANLRERKQPSEFAGKPWESPEILRIKETIREHRHDPDWHHSDEENFFELKERVLDVQKWIEQQTQKNIVLVSHEVFIKMFALLAIFSELLTPDLFLAYYRRTRMSHTGITMFEFDEKGWKLLTWNDYVHLGEDMKSAS